MTATIPKKVASAHQMDPRKTQPIGDLPDKAHFRLFHLKRGCKTKGEWQEYEVEHSRSDVRYVAAAYLPRSTVIGMIHMMRPDTLVEVVSLPEPSPAASSDPTPAVENEV